MKDGSPLIDEAEPTFIEMPSEKLETIDDEPDDVTVIRRNVSEQPRADIDDVPFQPDRKPQGQRIVVPTTEQQRPIENRPRTIPPYQSPIQKPNTAKVVVLTIIGTLAAVGLGAVALRLMQSDEPANISINTNFNSAIENVNADLNSNLGINTNFNFNAVSNFNTNSNVNLSLPNLNTGSNISNINTATNVARTPKPTATPTPKPSATPTPDDNRKTDPTPAPPTTPRPTQTPPRTVPTPANVSPANRAINRESGTY